MTDPIKKRLAALRKVAPKLNAVADEANKIVKEVEAALVEEMGIGVSATSWWFSEERERFVGKDDEVMEEETRECLAFGRMNGDYCIHILKATFAKGQYGEYDERIDSAWTRWSQCDRETRLKAFEKLAQLLDALVKKADTAAAVASETATKIRAMTSDEEEEAPVHEPTNGVALELDDDD